MNNNVNRKKATAKRNRKADIIFIIIMCALIGIASIFFAFAAIRADMREHPDLLNEEEQEYITDLGDLNDNDLARGAYDILSEFYEEQEKGCETEIADDPPEIIETVEDPPETDEDYTSAMA